MATPIFWMQDVLTADVCDSLFAKVLRSFQRVTSSGDEAPVVVAANVPEVSAVVQRLMPVAQELLDVGELSGKVESGITLHAHGQHTVLRNEAVRADGSPGGVVTFDYFLQRRPRVFRGGQLRVFDVAVRDGRRAAAASFRDVFPEADTLVMYPTSAWYEVKLVTCSSEQRSDGRFAVHGWIS